MSKHRTTKREFQAILVRLTEQAFDLPREQAEYYLKVAPPPESARRVASALWLKKAPETEDTEALRFQLLALEQDGQFDFETE